MRRSPGWYVLAIVTLSVSALLAPSSGLGVVQIQETAHDELAPFDSRSAVAAPTAAQLEAASNLGATVRWNRLGTPQSVINHGGYLTRGVDGGNAAAAARAWLESNGVLFGLESTDSLRVVADRALGEGGAYAVVFHQYVDSLPTPDGYLSVGLAQREGGWDIAYASSTIARQDSLATAADLGTAEAWAVAADAVDAGVSIANIEDSSRDDGWTSFEVSKLRGNQEARKVAFATPARGVRTAFETVVSDEKAGEMMSYRQVVDGTTGEILFRESNVDHSVDNPKWLVWEANPHAALDEFPWNYPSADSRELWCWFPDPACQFLPSTSLGDHEVEWDKDARTNEPTFTTIGNNANSSEAWFSSFSPGPTGYRPTSPTRDYTYPWTNAWFETRCDPANFVPGEGNDISAATANLFAMHNRMHDWSYALGFTEETWNAQSFNFGRNTPGENDPVLGQAQAGGVNGGYPSYAGRDNANMNTQRDGTSSITNMYLWQPLAGSFYAPCVDGDYDMSVIGHEYAHMIENRMIGKSFRRQGNHAGMMGESSGDLIGMEYVNEYNFAPAGGGDNPTRDTAVSIIGRYVTGSEERGIRNYDMAFPSAGLFPEGGKYPHVNPLNLSDLGYDITGPQVHADGEIWSATNFDLRELLLDRYPGQGTRIQRECADGHRPAQACPGNRRWVQLMFDAYMLMPVAPSFLNARDAYLAADVLRFGGANQDLLWLGFARRGFGQNAQVTNQNDSEPRADFESPLHEEATVVFNAFAMNEGNAPVTNAKFMVGHYERGVTPIADTNPATPPPYLDNVARFVPDGPPGHGGAHQRAYEFVVQAEGYGHVRFRITDLKPGETRVVNAYLPTNWASRHKGATAAGDGTRHNDLIDDTEGTNWESTGAPVEGRQVLIDLAGGAQRVDRVKVSTLLQPGQNRYTALREFEAYACSASPSGDVEVGGATYACRRIVKSQRDAFPGKPPRPVAPEMILRTWETGAGSGATHVLFRVLNNQCTGQPAFQGEQDNDPANTSTDCRIGTLPPLPPRNLEVRTSEFQVFSGKPRVEGAQQAD